MRRRVARDPLARPRLHPRLILGMDGDAAMAEASTSASDESSDTSRSPVEAPMKIFTPAVPGPPLQRSEVGGIGVVAPT